MNKDFWKNLKKPIIALAPMEGYTDSAFRHVCKLVNPEIITFTEFTSADAIHYNSEKSRQKFYFHKNEQPIIAQIFGKNVETFITATKFCEDLGFSGIDLNMGCPARKVVKSEHGIALRNNPEKAYELIDAVASNTKLPVSVKTRLGWDNADDLIEFGQNAEKAGANMITIHGRTYKNPYKVDAQFDPIYKLKESLNIPVIGNGGIVSIEDGMKKLGNLDGFMIGQACFGNPWVFATGQPKSFDEKIPLILNHLEFLIDHKGEKLAFLQIRKNLVNYVKGLDGAKEFRKKFVQVTKFEEVEEGLREIAEYQN